MLWGRRTIGIGSPVDDIKVLDGFEAEETDMIESGDLLVFWTLGLRISK